MMCKNTTFNLEIKGEKKTAVHFIHSIFMYERQHQQHTLQAGTQPEMSRKMSYSARYDKNYALSWLHISGVTM